jgi:hypothetical protein
MDTFDVESLKAAVHTDRPSEFLQRGANPSSLAKHRLSRLLSPRSHKQDSCYNFDVIFSYYHVCKLTFTSGSTIHHAPWLMARLTEVTMTDDSQQREAR